MFNLFLTQYNGIFIGPVAKLLGLILNALYEFLSVFNITNAALCIILFTFIVKSLMIPLTIKQQKFSKVSSAMNPELMKIQAKYKGKKDEASMKKQQLETQAVYQKYGSNPTSGCLPLLITIPIIFALYRVVYNIPAYVNDVHALYASIANGIQDTSGYTSVIKDYAKLVNYKISGDIQTNTIIDILAKLKTNQWSDLANSFPALKDTIVENSGKINDINSFVLGLNIANSPGLKWPGIIIPVLAAGFQFLQTKLMIVPNTNMDENSTAATTMKTMNNVMPIMSGVMCLAMPVGIGVYWIAGSVFQIIQQLAVNRYLSKIDVDDLIQRNVEKAKKRNDKLGIDPNKQLEELAKKQTKSIHTETKDYNPNKKSNNEPSNYTKSDVSYKAGSIAANANLLKNRNNSDKGDK